MNSKQKKFLVIGGLLIVLRLIFPVIHVYMDGYEYRVFYFTPFYSGGTYDPGRCKIGDEDSCISEYDYYCKRTFSINPCRVDSTRTWMHVYAVAIAIGISLFAVTKSKGINSS